MDSRENWLRGVLCRVRGRRRRSSATLLRPAITSFWTSARHSSRPSPPHRSTWFTTSILRFGPALHRFTENFLLAHTKLSTAKQETFHRYTRGFRSIENFLLVHKKLSISALGTSLARAGHGRRSRKPRYAVHAARGDIRVRTQCLPSWEIYQVNLKSCWRGVFVFLSK